VRFMYVMQSIRVYTDKSRYIAPCKVSRRKIWDKTMSLSGGCLLVSSFEIDIAISIQNSDNAVNFRLGRK
jgi:hypothetical protein